nr:unnamed protein product [Callosobruchus analis]
MLLKLFDHDNTCSFKIQYLKKIVLLLVGLDNAGKTKTAHGLGGDMHMNPVPNSAFSVVDLKYYGYDVKILDLAGGSDMRGLWQKYYVDAYGVIFVIDSSDYSRLSVKQRWSWRRLYQVTG